jgi:aspartate aminotransferase-like enzyme
VTPRQAEPAFGTFFLPGPTEVRPAVRQAMSGRMISHRGAEFRALYARVQQGLRVVFGTRRPVFIATSSAKGLMEAAIRNAPPGRVLALVNGGFSERFANVSVACGRAVDRYEVSWGAVHDAGEVTARVRAGGHAVVSVVHSETSTGALNDVRAISDAAHQTGAVCVIDSVSGIRGAELRFDEWQLDYVFTGSQKALAIPPGLAFAVASGQFLSAGEHDRRGIYFDLAEFEKNAEQDETPNTPALSLYYALDVQLESVLAEGMPAAWARHAAMCARTGDWAARLQRETGVVGGAPLPPRTPPPTVTAILTPPGVTPRAIVRGVAERGYTIGGGYGKLKDTTIRIGHMGDHTPGGLDGCLDACGAVLRALVK